MMFKQRFALMEEAGGAGGEDGSGGGGAAPWYQGVAGVDSEVIGHWANKGWDKKSAPEVALEATKAWKAAEHFVGVPANELLRLPKDATDEAGWNKIHTALGKPADAKGYDFTAVKRADGTGLDEPFANFMREQAFKLNLPKDSATVLAQEFARYQESQQTSVNTEKQAKLALEKTELAKNWGPNFEANKFIAQRGAQALGISPEEVAALENVVGYAKVMEAMRRVGVLGKEDKFFTGGREDSNGVMTREQAVARKADLMKDAVWSKSYLAGDAQKIREMTALNTIIVGDQRQVA